MKLSKLTLDALTPFITGGSFISGGDESLSPYLSGPKLIKFFNTFGTNDEYQGGLPNGWSRKQYTSETLKRLNGTIEFKALVEALTDSRRVDNPNEIALQITDIIKYDGYELTKNEFAVYKVSGDKLESPIIVEAHFKKIKSQILESIRNAKFSIWVAVAWFTDKDLANKLKEKHREGINVRIIVNDDKTTNLYGQHFDKKGIEYTKVSPNSPYGKKLMHTKFCIIDLNKVIHGSYNWTSNAQYNNEGITLIESRCTAEKFASQFIKLKNQKNI